MENMYIKILIAIKLIIKNTKIKKNIEYLLALLLVVTAVIIVID